MAQKDRLIQGYARALFAVAEAEGSLDDVEDELFRFGKTVERDPGLRDALTDPALPVENKKAVIRELLTDKANHVTMGLLGFLVEQGRVKDMPGIIEALVGLAAEQRRKAVAEVRTAVPLDEARRRQLAEALRAASGKDVELKVLVDPGVLGGVVARVGDQVFDGTIRRRLEMAREQLSQAR